jgi:LIVCS family branched-chain amino acid:cation transporter
MNKSKSNILKMILMGAVVFSMHFGGSSMIWPMTWGKVSGTNVFSAYSGIFLTALLFPLLAYIAIIRGGGTFFQLTHKVSNKFALIFCSLTILILGPLYTIPRMSAAAWDAFIQLTGIQVTSGIFNLLFSVVYYLIVYWFIAGKDGVVDKISKILLPVLLIAVVAIITKGLIVPLGEVAPREYVTNPFVYGFINGYDTAELLCALIFSTIIIEDLKKKNMSSNITRDLIIVCTIGIGILSLTHMGHMIIGSKVSTSMVGLKFAALYTNVVVELWGVVGGAIFNVALLLAALTTAIGLSLSSAEYFSEVTENRLKYKTSMIIVLVFSAIVSSLGLNTIVVLVTPFLKVIYPPAIVLTLFYSLGPKNASERAFFGFKLAIISSFAYGALEGIVEFMKMGGATENGLINFYNMIPLSEVSLGWVAISGALFFIGMAIWSKKDDNDSKMEVVN